MKIYTKTGDKGKTGLYRGKRVLKNHPLIDTIGEIDELNAILGVIRSLEISKKAEKNLEEIQHDLFLVGSTIVKQEKKMTLVISKKIKMLEKEIDVIERRLPKLQNFILPGGSVTSANLHLARTICRRLERKLVSLAKKIPKEIIPYFNRLSDFLFVLARFENRKHNKKEKIWKK